MNRRCRPVLYAFMMLAIALLIGLLCFACSRPSVVRTDEPPVVKADESVVRANQADLSSPAATLLTFEKAINKGDAAGMAACVAGSEKQLDPLTKVLTSEAVSVRLTIDEPKITGDTATVGIWSHVIEKQNNRKITTVGARDNLKLQRVGAKWFLQSGDLKSVRSSGRFLANMIVYTKFPNSARSPVHLAEDAVCINNVKMLALGMLEIVQDNEEKLAVTPSTFKTKTMTYVKSEEPYHCPLSLNTPSSYSLNPDIAGKDLGAIADFEHIVMIYEGQDRHLDFRHEGKAVVCFVNGEAKLVDADEARQLKWQ